MNPIDAMDEPTIHDADLLPSNRLLRVAYDQCSVLARKQARNFYYSFLVLPRPQRRAMCALYAFMRLTDDLGDNDAPREIRRQWLSDWRRTLDGAIAGTETEGTWWVALADTVARHGISRELLHAVIDGVESDLDVGRYETFADLYHYCYQVASVVGLSCIRIWGVRDRRARVPAEWCGVAFQLTNVLRDIAEDYRRGRIYLPAEDLRRFGVREEDLGRAEATPEFLRFMRFQIQRNQDYYDRGGVLMEYLPPAGRAILRVMTDIYRGMLHKIEADPSIVLRQRVSLSSARKLLLSLRALPLRYLSRPPVANTLGDGPAKLEW